MLHLRPGKFTLFSLLTIAIMLLAFGCSTDDNDPPAGLGSGTSEAGVDVNEPTSDTDAQDRVGNEITPMVTEAEEAADETPGEEGLPPPNPDGTQLPLADRTATPGDEGVGPQGEIIFPDVRSNGPDLENYTLTIVGDVAPAEGQDDGTETSVDLQFEQSSPDTFHLVFDGADEFDTEVWQVGEQMWVRDEEGNVVEASEELAESFGIDSYLAILPDVERMTEAEEVGQEEIDGRTVTHYSVSAEEALPQLPGAQNSESQNPEGSVEIWLDEEDTGNIIRMTVDLTWLDAEENEQSTQLEYTVSAIDETEEVTAPTQ